jgi:hypothetical protein
VGVPRGDHAGDRLLGGRIELLRRHQDGVIPHHRELLVGDVGDRRAEPAGVLEPDPGEHLHLRRDHVGRVVASAEARLDHGHLDPLPRELVVGRGRERLELGHAVVLVERAVDHPRRARHGRHGRAELVPRQRPLPHLDPLRERTQVRRRVGARPHVVAFEYRGDHARGGRLAVRPDHVNRREPPLRHPQRGHQLVHAVEPEPHAEQLEVEEVILRLGKRHPHGRERTYVW